MNQTVRQDNTDRILSAFDKISKVFASMESFGAETGISKPELLTIEVISRYEKIMMNLIAKNLNIGTSTATSIVDRLIEKNLVKRERNGGDRRAVRVVLTEKGKKINIKYQNQKKEMFSDMMVLLTLEEQECFIKALEKIAVKIQDRGSH
ncbi:MAG: MarR family transcriptional regulator [Actinobacteria bacterium]|nr:MarR family transcriptional regulator [Actinomycetota bacterium]